MSTGLSSPVSSSSYAAVVSPSDEAALAWNAPHFWQ
jgi:hypothetical protein